MKRTKRSRFAGPGTALAAFPFDLASDRAAPAEFRIFRKGENPSEKGLFIFDDTSALSVMREYAAHNKPMRFDYNHGTLLEAPPTPEAALSAGTFVPEVRAGELWATKCNWTARAAALVAAGEYGEFSPYFDHDKNGVVTRLINCALTNLPALNDIESLVAASATHNEDNSMEACTACAALNTRLSAMDEECKALKARLTMFEKEKDDDKTKASALTALTGKTSHPETLGVIQGWKAKAEAHDVLAARLEEQESTALRAELTATLDEGLTAGKVLGKAGETGTMRANLEARALDLGGGKPSKAGVAFLKALIPGLPKQVATGEITSPTGTRHVPGDEAKMNRLMNIDGAEFAKWQADQAARQ